MNSEHNPVALLVGQLQNAWQRQVVPDEQIQWVRWIIKPEQARLYEGFLKLESTEHGAIPDIPVVLLTPFEDSKRHSRALIHDWVSNYEEDQKTKDRLTNDAMTLEWDLPYFKQKLKEESGDFNQLLLELLKKFQRALPDTRRHLVLCLFPYTIQAVEDYRNWMETLLAIGLPQKTRLMVFDQVEQNYFEPLQAKYKTIAKSLAVTLDLDGAMQKLARSGDPNDPEVQFRQCMLEMGNSAAKNNRKRLHHWGEKGLEVTQKTGNKTAFATAHAVYAGMLFQFKEYDTLDRLLKRGLSISKQAKQAGDETINAILLQIYGYMAASAHHQKDIDKATDLFCKQAEMAATFGMGQQALSIYCTAYTLIQKKNPNRYNKVLKMAYTYGKGLPVETLRSSAMLQVAWDYYNATETDIQKKIDAFMKELEGKAWKEKIASQEQAVKAGISLT